MSDMMAQPEIVLKKNAGDGHPLPSPAQIIDK